jgi:hypothetical protein
VTDRSAGLADDSIERKVDALKVRRDAGATLDLKSAEQLVGMNDRILGVWHSGSSGHVSMLAHHHSLWRTPQTESTTACELS